jgi:hypothetical protein
MCQQDKIDIASKLVDNIANKYDLLMSMDAPKLHLHQFLLDEQHKHVLGIQEQFSNVAFNMEAPAKRGRKGEGCITHHKKLYSKSQLPAWSPVDTRDESYSTNPFFKGVPLREQDSILYWELVQPVHIDDQLEEELTTYLCLNLTNI